MSHQPHYVTEQVEIRRIANDSKCRWIWKPHAILALAEEDYSAADVQAGLRACTVVLHENKSDILYRAICRDIDGKKFTVILAYFSDIPAIKIVTVF